MHGRPTEELLEAARAGREGAADALWRRFEPWLRCLAQGRRESRFDARFDPEDLVQQAMLEAYRDFARFRGRTEAEFAAWLRGILAHVWAHAIRHHAGTDKRNLDLEVSLDQELTGVSQRLGDLVPGEGGSPATHAVRLDRERRVAAALERLPPDYRTVIRLRHLEGLPHEEVARRMGRPSGAVRMLWVRALARFRDEVLASGTACDDRRPTA